MFSKILFILKWVLTLGAFVTLIITSYKYLEDMKTDTAYSGDKVVEYVKEAMDSTWYRFDVLSKKLDNINYVQLEMIDNQNRLRNTLINHMANDKSVTKEDMYKFMQEIGGELKKNNYVYQEGSFE